MSTTLPALARASSAPCALEGCIGMNGDGTCPNGYGVTCESLLSEPTNMDDDPLRARPKGAHS